MAEKIEIEAFSDEDRKDSAGTFMLSLNPEKVSVSYSINTVESGSAQGSGTNSSQTAAVNNRTVSFEILLDGTGIVPESGNVADKVKELSKLIWEENKDSHRPNYLVLNWGKVFDNFKCMLQNLRLEYQLFDMEGNPLRAKVNLEFVEHENPKKDGGNTNRRSSPDMSRLHTVRIGDSLPHLCAEYYDNPYLFPEIARINKLVNFRSLEIGSQIYFPPMER